MFIPGPKLTGKPGQRELALTAGRCAKVERHQGRGAIGAERGPTHGPHPSRSRSRFHRHRRPPDHSPQPDRQISWDELHQRQQHLLAEHLDVKTD